MAASTTPGSFADTFLARLIALGIAFALAAILYVNWADDMRKLMAEREPEMPRIAAQGPVQKMSEGLRACLDQRVGDVDRMKSEGVINDAQHASFRARAQQLCSAQNPN